METNHEGLVATYKKLTGAGYQEETIHTDSEAGIKELNDRVAELKKDPDIDVITQQITQGLVRVFYKRAESKE